MDGKAAGGALLEVKVLRDVDHDEAADDEKHVDAERAEKGPCLVPPFNQRQVDAHDVHLAAQVAHRMVVRDEQGSHGPHGLKG